MAGLSVFNKRPFRVRPQLLQSATLSDFGGGLNVADNDLTMKSRFAKVSDNVNKNIDGSLSIRWGTGFKYDISGVVTGTLIEVQYFNRHLLAFTTTGQIAKITEAGVITAIWNPTIAAALPGAPSGWSTGLVVGSIDTSEFKGDLIVVNGVDKPLIISKLLVAKYLSDPATGSNIYTPISKYVTTVSNYLVMSGITANGAEVYISAQGTSGVWPGDAPPNDSVTINLGAWVPQNTGDIIGLGSFRNNLIVGFNGAIAVVELGQYDNATTPNHVPKVQDNIVERGMISHRTTMTTKNDFIMADILGWHTAVRNQFGLVDTKGLSELVDPEYMQAVPADTDRPKAFSVHNKIENRFMTFLPTSTGAVAVYVMSSSDKETIKSQAFNVYKGWDWTCGCMSERGRVYLGKGTRIYQYGNSIYPGEAYTADKVGDYQAAWATATVYAEGYRVLQGGKTYYALVAHTSTVFADDLDDLKWAEYFGEPIDFDFELPWADINQRARKKVLKSLQADTKGKASFTFEVYVDNFYKDVQTGDYTPAVAMEFVAGDSLGYGGGDQPYGGGRRLRDERPYAIPAEFKLMKIRIHGSTRLALQIVTLTILYYMGTYRR